MIINYQESFNWLDKHQYCVSSITHPLNHSIVFCALKIKKEMNNLYAAEDCFVFVQEGILVAKEIEAKHTICFVANPSTAFGDYIEHSQKEKVLENRKKIYKSSPVGFIFGENVTIGVNTFIEPGVFIDHNVVIGDNCVILRNAVLRNCVIGNNCSIYENVFIGNAPFNYYNSGNTMKRSIPLGRVLIGNNVDIGSYSVIDRGTVSDTVLEDYVKLDAIVRVGHDAVLHKNVLMTSFAVAGAFCEINENVKVYGSKVMKRTKIGRNAVLGFNSSVMFNVKENETVFGSPATRI